MLLTAHLAPTDRPMPNRSSAGKMVYVSASALTRAAGKLSTARLAIAVKRALAFDDGSTPGALLLQLFGRLGRMGKLHQGKTRLIAKTGTDGPHFCSTSTHSIVRAESAV